MDTKQDPGEKDEATPGPEDAWRPKTVEDENDTEGQRRFFRAIPDDAPATDDAPGPDDARWR